MNRSILFLSAISASFGLGFFFNSLVEKRPIRTQEKPTGTETSLGAFSISLSVKDLAASQEFYETLGFSDFAGDMKANYLIMKNGNALIGLFEGMFEGNMLTFNPGWDENAQEIKEFRDVRVIQNHLKSKNIEIMNEADESSSGPASFLVKDPDGNLILVDQHR
ncbi:VOC family protein [Algoriphagus sp. Y33]|uniref:VOC family protein n=1 Tax=Algoriphagus sp. Y33 TaxID=2772483 RepID=UPI00351C992C